MKATILAESSIIFYHSTGFTIVMSTDVSQVGVSFLPSSLMYLIGAILLLLFSREKVFTECETEPLNLFVVF